MAVYSEEEPLYALLAAGYKTIKNSNPSQFFFTLLCAKMAQSLGETIRWPT